MTLTVHDQLMVLHDILGEHTMERSGEVAEYQQIKRLVQSMMAKKRITDKQLLNMLPEIYNYGRQGENAQNSPEHVATNKKNIENWMNAITNVHFE
ncbi:YtzH-like family protein [Lentibacillus sp. N15]|uniref:YtzH-like family protein n=1 Tax=Lentibacillus songyuanensis TaxID=3136161 RepID=UPI0031BA1F78